LAGGARLDDTTDAAVVYGSFRITGLDTRLWLSYHTTRRPHHLAPTIIY
jgi:hypothetical protein